MAPAPPRSGVPLSACVWPTNNIAEQRLVAYFDSVAFEPSRVESARAERCRGGGLVNRQEYLQEAQVMLMVLQGAWLASGRQRGGTGLRQSSPMTAMILISLAQRVHALLLECVSSSPHPAAISSIVFPITCLSVSSFFMCSSSGSGAN